MAGNPNPTGAKPDKLIRDALKAAIRQEPTKLKRMAEKVLDMAVDGDMQAVNFIADRVDGKAVQAIVGDDEAAPIRTSLTVEFVSAALNNSNT